ncbi:MAG: sigma-70 family RNA polymerase sigma factor [Acidobacteriota bacterium]
MSDESDEILVDRARRGDDQAYAELICRYRERIYHTIFRFTRNHHDTDDLAQETFWRAYRKLSRFRRESGFYTWIFRIAVNQSLNFLKKKKAEMNRAAWSDGFSGDGRASLPGPDAVSETAELRERLEEAIDSLTPAYKTAWNLVVFQEMTHGQAARVLRCSEKTISWRMHKARKLIQARLRPFLERGER